MLLVALGIATYKVYREVWEVIKSVDESHCPSSYYRDSLFRRQPSNSTLTMHTYPFINSYKIERIIFTLSSNMHISGHVIMVYV